jgi:gamma-glutamylputrescine oxidase
MNRSTKSNADHIRSWYAATAHTLPNCPTLEESIDADVCVVGGGFTGLAATLTLSRAGYRVALVESRRIGWGASGRNGGQIGSGQRKDMLELESMVSGDDAKRFWSAAQAGKRFLCDLVEQYDIQCDLHWGHISAASKPSHADHLHRYSDHLKQKYGYLDCDPISRSTMREHIDTSIYFGGLLDRSAGHLHPLNYALGIARAALDRGAQLYEKTAATTIDSTGTGHRVVCESGQVTAKSVLLACNGYLERLHPRLAGKIMPINNYIIATEPLGEQAAQKLIRGNLAVADTRFVVNYYRLSTDTRLLFGGGENYRRRFPADIPSFVRKHMLNVFPQLSDKKIDFGWGGTLAITLNRMPSVGRVDGDIYYAQGFSGHGVVMAGYCGHLVAQAITGTMEGYDLFARLPQPRFPGGTLLRWPGLVAGMLYYSLRDRL